MDKRGVFTSVTEAINASKGAFDLYKRVEIEGREEIISALRKEFSFHIDTLAQMIYDETQMGRLADKKKKIRLAIDKTPGTEDLTSEAVSGAMGLTLYELSAYGVCCCILPSTNPVATFIHNVISMIAAGNTVVVCGHLRATETTKYLVDLTNKCIAGVSGIENMVVTLEQIGLDETRQIMNNPSVELVLATGGSDMARSAIACGKKVLSAGPGNPTFIVDETADIKRAVRHIIRGATFDNNTLCIGEKNIIIVEDALEEFKKELIANDVFYIDIDDMPNMLKLSKVLLNSDALDMAPRKSMGGKDAMILLDLAGIKPKSNTHNLIAVETCKIHPFVTEELLMPLISIVKVKDFDEALEVAKVAEKGNRHTAGIHSGMIERLSIAAKEMQTSIFVKNGCSLNAIGFESKNATSFSIANQTGEGVVTARTLTRRRKCCLVEALSIR